MFFVTTSLDNRRRCSKSPMQPLPGLVQLRNWHSLSERPRSLLLSLGVPSRLSPGSHPGPIQVPSRVRRGPVQIRHVLCFTAFWTHPGPEVGAIPARPGPILLPSVPSRIGPGRAETDFLATSEQVSFAPVLGLQG